MPHITITATDTDRVMQTVNIHVYVYFSSDYFKSHKAKEKLEQLQKELENVVEIYFDGYESEAEMSNHRYNEFMKK